ncbi:phosphomethylpyrimidine kinase [Fructobacillus pseudoficulneus]|uniref:Hydroxymethylpyrimidine/phosphomethylpyrimidine kinase n=1 Tax=Fructobacillus pseudoficulneus TaxID=220714 RepID=A0A3F3H1U6_9LACO|nr:bifunctional hydroxymethylpyrimidine kinase/phosphomethylpyrimidine kinase [Fructobacillus pseudoficulneus]GAP02568.1 phosphomethylpyrimidine kinase [Fructobacillus pseudoficulneus]SEH38259.1 hydroxymethylpyrimidine/phosphomethylpyrimidine kinase [Fructobacillus pseudoficulneus]
MIDPHQYPTALTIAGSDSGGGAGMQADIKTMQACETFSTVVVVGLTAQNTLGVQGAYPTELSVIDEQFASVMADFDVRAAKTGALFDRDHVLQVAKNLRDYNQANLVVDPVMVAKGGATLLDPAGIEALKQSLLPLATLVTPNLPEAELLADMTITSRDEMVQAAKKIRELGVANVIVKGGHGDGPVIYDYVLLADQEGFWLEGPKVETSSKHGTGDTLSAAITSFLAQGDDLKTAIIKGHRYMNTIIGIPLPLGHGHGPLNHGRWAGQGAEE